MDLTAENKGRKVNRRRYSKTNIVLRHKQPQNNTSQSGMLGKGVAGNQTGMGCTF